MSYTFRIEVDEGGDRQVEFVFGVEGEGIGKFDDFVKVSIFKLLNGFSSYLDRGRGGHAHLAFRNLVVPVIPKLVE